MISGAFARYGGRVWDSAFALASWLERRHPPRHGRAPGLAGMQVQCPLHITLA